MLFKVSITIFKCWFAKCSLLKVNTFYVVFSSAVDHDRIPLGAVKSLLKAEKSNDLSSEPAIRDKKQKISTMRLQCKQKELELERDVQQEVAQTS